METVKSASCLIAISGPPGVGKTTLANELKKGLQDKSLAVSSVHWDDVLASLNITRDLDRDLIYSTTKKLIDIVTIKLNEESPDVVIIDGVFVYDDELKWIENLASKFSYFRFYQLQCSLSNQIQRNNTRDPFDILPEERLFEVNNDFKLQTYKISTSEIINADKSIEYNISIMLEDLLYATDRNHDNITLTENWSDGVKSRFSSDDLISLNEKILFSKESKDTLLLNSYFNLDGYENAFIEFFNNNLCAGIKIRAKYINKESVFLKKITHLELQGKINLRIIDCWKNPQIIIRQNLGFESYVASFPTRLKRTIARNSSAWKDLNLKTEYSSANDMRALELYSKALAIDDNSWKSTEKSNMRSLNREDLQYVPFFNNSPANCSLVITSINNRPEAFSLMMRTSLSGKWFAVKWGCSDRGKKHSLGIYTLRQHVEALWQERLTDDLGKSLYIDLWGRNSAIYDQFSNHSNDRCHLEITKL
ncbi:MAG: ATP-binding protein [Oligoflexia bacterium]|nr:ATP-binding protein [Oligoflexia bacterium]